MTSISFTHLSSQSASPRKVQKIEKKAEDCSHEELRILLKEKEAKVKELQEKKVSAEKKCKNDVKFFCNNAIIMN